MVGILQIMARNIYTKITGTGCYIPSRVIKNDYFKDFRFFDPSTKALFDKPNEEIISKFEEITNIKERRWIEEDKVTSNMAAEALQKAVASAEIDIETLDFIIVGTNFGDVNPGNISTDVLPAVASKVKALLKIKNPACVAHDVIAGCPGWTQAMIVADAYIRSGLYKRGAVIGADVLSRISDPHDRDSMIYADGAGAVIVERVDSDEPTGIISHSSRSDCDPYANLLFLAPSFNEELDRNDLYLKMLGHKLYVYAISYVPGVVKESIEKAGLQLSDIKKVLIHQANEKMDDSILKGVFKLYKEKNIPEGIMPMSIRRLGNSSAATVPTLLDLVVKGEMEGHEIKEGDYIILCSVGAGMNINSIIYKW